jgi:succinate dehydrogenase / fumarate reductase cytochrome b subunit
MAVALNRENYVLHKLHSLTGVIPVGYYVVQHLVLNSYSLAGPEKFNGVIMFFESLPKFFLLAVEAVAIWIPLLFHAIYGVFIHFRAQPNFLGTKYGWSQNRMFVFQRWTGLFLFFFLSIHVATTTGLKYLNNSVDPLLYNAWYTKLTSNGFIWLIFYMLGVAAAAYHLGYGIWNFCIRWGITISDKAQMRVQKVSFALFILITLIGWGALGGFLMNKPATQPAAVKEAVPTAQLPEGTQ